MRVYNIENVKDTINSYLAVLIITLAGAGATMLIVHVVFNNSFVTTLGGSEASYASLQQSILNP